MGIDTAVKHQRIGESIRAAITAIDAVTEPTWEQKMALTRLEEAEQWARKAVAVDAR